MRMAVDDETIRVEFRDGPLAGRSTSIDRRELRRLVRAGITVGDRDVPGWHFYTTDRPWREVDREADAIAVFHRGSAGH